MFSDGASGILGLTSEHVGLGVRRNHLSPAGTYGGCVSSQRLGRGHWEALDTALSRWPSLSWRISPHDGVDDFMPVGAVHEHTHVIDLRDGAAAARRRWKAPARRQAARATRAGVAFREASTLSDWSAYDSLYRTSLGRWDRPSSIYEERLFTLLHDSGLGSVRLFVAEKETKLAAGAIVFLAGHSAVYWHGASLARDVPGASNLLHWELLDVLEADGVGIYDLNPSGGHEGVAHFKETLGAEARPAPILVRRHPRENLAFRYARLRARLPFLRPR